MYCSHHMYCKVFSIQNENKLHYNLTFRDNAISNYTNKQTNKKNALENVNKVVVHYCIK